MLKFILILFLLIYISFRIGGYFLRVLLGGGNPTNRNQYQKPRPKDGNVKVDSIPGKGKKDFDGGEYVDYEEVD